MTTETVHAKLEGVRVMLWAMARLLERDDAHARAALFEMRTLAITARQLVDEILD